MTKQTLIPLMSLVLLSPLAVKAENAVEVGGLALVTGYRSTNVRSGPSIGSVGFAPGPSAGGFLGQNMGEHFGGEIRYLYAQNDLKLKSGGSEAKFSGRSHILNYDLMYYFAGRRAHIRPFVAGGVGLKRYQGTGAETAFQPLSNLALLTKTSETLLAGDFGGGVKVHFSRNAALRFEFRDYISKVPRIFEPSPGARISGLLHHWVPAVGISWTF